MRTARDNLYAKLRASACPHSVPDAEWTRNPPDQRQIGAEQPFFEKV
jgi:hypothetical protein